MKRGDIIQCSDVTNDYDNDYENWQIGILLDPYGESDHECDVDDEDCGCHIYEFCSVRFHDGYITETSGTDELTVISNTDDL